MASLTIRRNKPGSSSGHGKNKRKKIVGIGGTVNNAIRGYTGEPGVGGVSDTDFEGGATDKREARMIIYSKQDKDAKIMLYRPPKEIDYSGFANTYNEAARPDRKPLLRRTGRGLRKISMTFVLGNTIEGTNIMSLESSIDNLLDTLEKLAQSDFPLIIEYEPRTKGKWNITDMTYRSIERNSNSDNISRAEVTIEFTETKHATGVTINDYTAKTRPKSYKVKQGDTLLKIVKKFYATDSPRIVKAVGKANNPEIKNAKRELKRGRKIKLP